MKQSNTNDKRKPEKIEAESFTIFERGGQSDPLQIEQKSFTGFQRGGQRQDITEKNKLTGTRPSLRGSSEIKGQNLELNKEP